MLKKFKNYFKKPNSFEATALKNHQPPIYMAHKWNITNFSSYLDESSQWNSVLVTGDICPPDNIELKFELKLWPKGCNAEYSDYVSVDLYTNQLSFIRPFQVKTCDLKCMSVISIFNSNKEKCFTKGNTIYLDKKSLFQILIFYLQAFCVFNMTTDEGISLPDFVSKNLLLDPENAFLPNDTLTLFCEVSCNDFIIFLANIFLLFR